MLRLSLCLACAAALRTPLLRTPLRKPLHKTAPMITMGLSKSITDSFPALVAGAAPGFLLELELIASILQDAS